MKICNRGSRNEIHISVTHAEGKTACRLEIPACVVPEGGKDVENVTLWALSALWLKEEEEEMGVVTAM